MIILHFKVIPVLIEQNGMLMEHGYFLKMKPITKSLSDISLIMNDVTDFVRLRFQFEQWEKEANEGNLSSAELVKLVNQFEKLIKHIIKK